MKKTFSFLQFNALSGKAHTINMIEYDTEEKTSVNVTPKNAPQFNYEPEPPVPVKRLTEADYRKRRAAMYVLRGLTRL